jgi:hypothetical protein
MIEREYDDPRLRHASEVIGLTQDWHERFWDNQAIFRKIFFGSG